MKRRRVGLVIGVALPMLSVLIASKAVAQCEVPYNDEGYDQCAGPQGPANPLSFEHSPPLDPNQEPDQGGYMNPFCGSDEQSSTGCVLGDYAATDVYPFSTGNQMSVVQRTPTTSNVTGEMFVTITCSDDNVYDTAALFDDSNPNAYIDVQCPSSTYATDVTDYVELWYHG
jgi:hypothetical protein